MFPIIGIVVVIGSVIGGYLLEHGNLAVLVQPAELVIIGGAAAGTVLIGNPPSVLKALIAGVLSVFKGARFDKAFYVATLQSLFTITQKARKGTLTSLETDIEDPDKSALFSKFPPGRPDHHIRDFVCDNDTAEVLWKIIQPFNLRDLPGRFLAQQVFLASAQVGRNLQDLVAA